MDLGTLRFIERFIIVLAATAFGYFGYKLFVFGRTRGASQMQVESKLFKLVFSGTAPGLFFMLCGASVLIVALLKGGVSYDNVTVQRHRDPPEEAVVKDLTDEIGKESRWIARHTKYSVQGGGGPADVHDPKDLAIYNLETDLYAIHEQRCRELVAALKLLGGDQPSASATPSPK
jgi:hypothetical protein